MKTLENLDGFTIAKPGEKIIDKELEKITAYDDIKIDKNTTIDKIDEIKDQKTKGKK